MKKIFVSMIMAGALLLGGNAYAQTNANNSGNPKAKTEKKECKGEGQCPNCPEGKVKAGKKAFNPFDGIQLTEDQQQRLQVLQQGLGPVKLTPTQEAKIKENPNLTPEQKKQLKEAKKVQRVESKKKYLNGVKEILTPEQYVVFLENVYIYGPGNQVKAAKKHDKKMKHLNKGEKNKSGQKVVKERKAEGKK